MSWILGCLFATISDYITDMSILSHIQSQRYFILVSKPAPDFEGTAVINGEFKDLKLEDFKGKYLVLFFYPLDL